MKRDATSDVPNAQPQPPRESGIFPRSAANAPRRSVEWHSRRETIVSMRASIRPPAGPSREVAALVQIARPPRMPKNLGAFLPDDVQAPTPVAPAIGWTRKAVYVVFAASMTTLAAAAAAMLGLRR